jgi:hypothetical protein
MMATPTELAEVLAGTVLDGREIVPVSLPQITDVMLAIPCAGLDALDAWHAARALRDITGRYPTITTAYPDLVGVIRGGYHPDKARSAADILREVDNVDVRAVLDGLIELDQDPDPVDLTRCQHDAGETRRAVGHAPSAEQILAEVGPDADADAIDRWLLDWEIQHADPRASEFIRNMVRRNPLHNRADTSGQRRYVCLWPTAEPWQIAAHAAYYGADGMEAGLCATLRAWERRYGAQLVGINGVEMYITVDSTPATIDEAWRLAADHIAWGRSYQGARRHLAEGLLDSPSWYFFERP